MNARLDAVTKAKQAYVIAKTTMENRLREQLKEELANMQTQIDIAVRYAYDTGESKANILRAMGTKDYHTLNAALERTQGVAEVVGDDPLDRVYHVADGVLHVSYIEHGPESISGHASFNVKTAHDGIIFEPLTPLYSDDFKQRNRVVGALEAIGSWYYEEAVGWWNAR
jgi:hypothetical protein